MFGNKLFELLNSEPHVVDSAARYDVIEKTNENRLFIGDLDFFVHKNGGKQRLLGVVGNYVVEIEHSGTSCLKGQEDVHSMLITVSLGRHVVKRVVTDAGMNVAGRKHFDSTIALLMKTVASMRIDEHLGGVNV